MNNKKLVRVVVDLNLDTGDYEMKISNLSNPGNSLDYMKINSTLKKIFIDVDNQIDDTGIDSTDEFIKDIH